MLTELCMYLKNWFCSDSEKHISDNIKIENGVLTSSFGLKENQYYRIIGSVFNDGVHQYGSDEDVLIDETFCGSVWCMRIPKEVIELSKEIDDFKSKNKISAFQSESFEDYSYTKATDANGKVVDWKSAFSTRLRGYMKI